LSIIAASKAPSPYGCTRTDFIGAFCLSSIEEELFLFLCRLWCSLKCGFPSRETQLSVQGGPSRFSQSKAQSAAFT
jgi:hypothetical protein